MAAEQVELKVAVGMAKGEVPARPVFIKVAFTKMNDDGWGERGAVHHAF
jgi:hypothetical protein